MQLFSLYSENNECSYFHCTVKIMNAVIPTGKIGKGRIKRKQNICNGVRTCIGLTSPLGLLPYALTTTPRRHT